VTIFLSMEYFPTGDLDACIEFVTKESDARKIALQLLEALLSCMSIAFLIVI
jgi:hypothetical protein